jgi:hypothetical protein
MARFADLMPIIGSFQQDSGPIPKLVAIDLYKAPV